PIVFSGMNSLPGNYNRLVNWMDSLDKPGHNITGVYEKIHFSTAVKIQKKIQPAMARVRVISDNSPTGKALIQQVKQELASSPVPVDIEYFITDSWEQYQQEIEKSNQADVDTLYPIALRLVDRAGKTHAGGEVIRWTSRNTNKPSISLNFSFVKHGFLGGAGVDFESMGRQAGLMAARILEGLPAGSIAIEDAQRYALVFNLNRAKELGIAIPADILLAADEVYQDQ
ncbi:MAG: hypothetical protein OQK12_03840, partial [Motiliproteus sp.]|nr:hypothetical protein [Motiliproteus sp.]